MTEVKNGWAICPWCKKRIMPVDQNARCRGLRWKCRLCGKVFEIRIGEKEESAS